MAIKFTLRKDGDTSIPSLARAYGNQSTKGIPCLWDANEAGGKRFILLLSTGGRFGCDGIDEYRYAGGVIEESVDGGHGWIFHPGTRTSGYDDPVQGRPTFFPELDFVFDGKCYLEVSLASDTPGIGDPDAEPGESEVFMRGLRVQTYSMDANGRLKEEGPEFSANNMNVSLDLLRECGKMPLSRFHLWAQSWIDFHDTCAELLSWNNGTETIDVPRYDAHVVFAGDIPPVTAFNAVMLRAPGCKWQDVQGGIRILTTPDRDPVHRLSFDPTQTLTRSNIVRDSFSGTPRAPEDIPNFWIFTYRDLLDREHSYKQRQVVVDYAELRDSADGILNVQGPIDLGLMTGSLAQRTGKCMARLVSEQPFDRVFNAKGQMDSAPVAKNDNIELTHNSISVRETEPLLARVVKETYEPTKGERTFIVQLTTRDYYRDSDHGPLDDETPTGPAPFSPASVSGLIFRIKGGALTGFSDGDTVETPADISGGGHNPTQPTSGARAVYKENILNGKAALRFSGSQYYSTTLDMPDSYTILIVYANRTGSGSFFGIVNALSPLQRDPAIWSDAGRANISVNGGSSINPEGLLTLINDAVAPLFGGYFNGGGYDSTSDAGAAPAGNLQIGRTGYGSGEYLSADVLEVCLYNRADISVDDMTALKGYVSTEYGLTLS